VCHLLGLDQPGLARLVLGGACLHELLQLQVVAELCEFLERQVAFGDVLALGDGGHWRLPVRRHDRRRVP